MTCFQGKEYADPGHLYVIFVPTISTVIANTVIRSSKELKENTVIIVLGASGDLAKKKTFPALFGLVMSLLLPH